MKIRTGFVSNSSSSSFVIIGFELESDKMIEIAEKLYSGHKMFPKKPILEKIRGCEHKEVEAKFCPECGKPMWITNEEDFEEYEYEVEDFINDCDSDDEFKIEINQEIIGEDSILVGVEIKSSLDGVTISFNNIDKRIEKLSEIIDVNKNDVKIFSGVYKC